MRFISLNRSSDEMGDFRQVEEINEILFFSGIDTDMHVRQVWQNILFYKIPYVLIVLSS